MNRDPLALYPLHPLHTIPAVTTAQMREVDRLAVQDAQLSVLQMMENAGRALALVARDYLQPPSTEPTPSLPSVLVIAGTGNNGGGALAAARHLRNWGYDPSVVLAGPPGTLEESASRQHQTLHKDGLRPVWPGAHDFDSRFPDLLQQAAVVIDGLVGYGLEGPLQGDTALLVEAILDRAPPAVISLDVPSGFDATTGAVATAGVVATVTLTLALPKTGLLEGDAAAAIGDLLLADIGIPRSVYRRLDMDLPPDLFAEGPVVRLVGAG